MHALYNFLSLALVSVAAAQSTNTALQLQAIQAHFSQAQIVPQLLSSFQPSALLTVNYAGVGDTTPGQLLNKAQSAPTPTVSVTPANASVQLTGTYTIMMMDADIVGADTSKGVNRHWLVNGVKVTDGKVSSETATAITAYAGPGPAAGSGPHRYTIILYEQPESFKAPAGFQEPIGVTRMDLAAYVKDSGLGALVAANYIQVEDGTATVSLVSTSAVVTSTLPAAASPTGSGSSTGTGKPTGTGAAGGATTSAPPKNGAVTVRAGAASVLIGFAGLAAMIML